MGAKGFILAVLAVAAAGAGAGYGATFVFPPPEAPPVTSSLAPDPGGGGEPGDGAANGGGGNGGEGNGGAVFREEDLPEEVRQAMAQDPEMAAQIRQAIESGQIPPGAFGPPGGAGADGGGGGAPGFAGGGATPLTGTILSYADGTLRLDTADGEADVAVAPDTPVNVSKTPSEAGEYLAEGAEVTVAAQGEPGAMTALAVFAGPVPDELAQAPALASFVTIVSGTVESFADGTLTVAGDDGTTALAAGDQTIVSASLTAADAGDELAEGASVTAFVERGADGGLEASSIEAGDIGGGFGGAPFGGGGFGGGFGGGAAFGGAAGQFPGADALSPEEQQAREDNREARIQRRVTRQTLGTGRPQG